MPTLRLFAAAREMAGTGRADIEASNVREAVDRAVELCGPALVDLLPVCGIWVNGEVAELDVELAATDEVAILPPVSGGR
jgi:molybdopterin converting factor small subunit